MPWASISAPTAGGGNGVAAVAVGADTQRRYPSARVPQTSATSPASAGQDVELHREGHGYLCRVEGDEPDRAGEAVGCGEVEGVAQSQGLVTHQSGGPVEAR